MIRKLQRKFVIITMSIVTIMLGFILGLIFFFTKENVEAANIAMMQSIANRPFQKEIPESASEGIRLPYFSVRLDANGNLLEVGGNYYDLSDEIFLGDLIKNTLNQKNLIGTIEDYHFRFCRVITPVNQTIVYSDISSEQATLSHLMRTCFLIGSLSFLTFLVIAIQLAKWAVRPIEQAWIQQKQFIADASHELKTPLTVITTNAELLQNPTLASASGITFSSNILTMSRQMRTLLEQMLSLAKTEQLDTKANFRTLDLSSLVSDALLTFEPLYYEKGYVLETDIEEDIRITGDSEKLKQAIDILLDNASKYTAEKGHIRVSLKKLLHNRILLVIADEGAPISEEELPLLFRRFYRTDKARSRDGSYGLGLAIAESIVQQHKGKIWAESKEGWNRFYIEFLSSARKTLSCSFPHSPCR